MKNLFNYKDHKPRRIWCTQHDEGIEVGASHTNKTKATFQLIMFGLIIAMGRYVSLDQPIPVLMGYFIILVCSGLWFAQNVLSNTIITISKHRLTYFQGFWIFGIRKNLSLQKVKLSKDQYLKIQEKESVVFGHDLSLEERNYFYGVLKECLGKNLNVFAVAA